MPSASSTSRKFFRYQPKLCAHSRNEQIGCTACIDVCSARAIRSDASLKGKLQGKAARAPGAKAPGAASAGGGIVVEPHLCVGCGACGTVCPSGALSFTYPSPADQGRKLRTLLAAYAAAGGRDAALLLHSEGAGTQLIDQLGRAARVDKALHGVPARVLPLALWHTASVGLDLWLAAIAQGAAQVWVLLSDEEAPEYRSALAAADGGGAGDPVGPGLRRRALPPARGARRARPGRARRRAARARRRRAWRAPPASPSRPTSAPRSTWRSTTCWRRPPPPPKRSRCPPPARPSARCRSTPTRCTLCLSCVGACPEAALADNPDKPQLRFIEKNCVQCGLCASTCPEDAITLQPRLWLADGGKARKQHARAGRDGALPLHPLRQALRHAARDREHAHQAGRPCGLPGRGRRAPEDVRRLPRHRHPHQPRRSPHHRPVTMSNPTTGTDRLRQPPTTARNWPAPSSTACWRGCGWRRPTPS